MCVCLSVCACGYAICVHFETVSLRRPKVDSLTEKMQAPHKEDRHHQRATSHRSTTNNYHRDNNATRILPNRVGLNAAVVKSVKLAKLVKFGQFENDETGIDLRCSRIKQSKLVSSESERNAPHFSNGKSKRDHHHLALRRKRQKKLSQLSLNQIKSLNEISSTFNLLVLSFFLALSLQVISIQESQCAPMPSFLDSGQPVPCDKNGPLKIVELIKGARPLLDACYECKCEKGAVQCWRINKAAECDQPSTSFPTGAGIKSQFGATTKIKHAKPKVPTVVSGGAGSLAASRRPAHQQRQSGAPIASSVAMGHHSHLHSHHHLAATSGSGATILEGGLSGGSSAAARQLRANTGGPATKLASRKQPKSVSSQSAGDHPRAIYQDHLDEEQEEAAIEPKSRTSTSLTRVLPNTQPQIRPTRRSQLDILAPPRFSPSDPVHDLVAAEFFGMSPDVFTRKKHLAKQALSDKETTISPTTTTTTETTTTTSTETTTTLELDQHSGVEFQETVRPPPIEMETTTTTTTTSEPNESEVEITDEDDLQNRSNFSPVTETTTVSTKVVSIPTSVNNDLGEAATLDDQFSTSTTTTPSIQSQVDVVRIDQNSDSELMEQVSNVAMLYIAMGVEAIILIVILAMMIFVYIFRDKPMDEHSTSTREPRFISSEDDLSMSTSSDGSQRQLSSFRDLQHYNNRRNNILRQSGETLSQIDTEKQSTR